MEQRVRKLETDVAVLGNRQDTAEADIAIIKEDYKALSQQMSKNTGLILGGMTLLQALSYVLTNG